MNRLLQKDFSSNQVRLDISRSTFNLDTDFLGTANAGKLNVCFFEEVLPGDTFNVNAI